MRRARNIFVMYMTSASSRTVQGAGLRPLVCWDCGFEPRQGHGFPSLVSVVYCQVKVTAPS